MVNTPLELLLKYNGQIPRYTSYPPAPFFTQSPEAIGYEDLLRHSNAVGPTNVSFYFHVPFCPKRCLFCGCHTEIGRPGAFIKTYMESLLKEVDLLLPLIEADRPVTQIHFGGGTPNAVPYTYLDRILTTLRERMPMQRDAEVAIECDPNLVSLEKLEALAAMGFNRVSFGIQDFNLKVLETVNRRFPKVEPRVLFARARELGFAGNNLDLIYGLPYQTLESFRDTVQKAIDAGPDRISLFPYAHVPWIKDHQSALAKHPMPDSQTRLSIAWESREALLRAGYEAIGMDHFAKRDDELALAVREGLLHRNFQGYCPAERAGQVYALGASAITQLHQGYLQNTKELAKYEALIAEGKLPVENGYRMRPEDIVVREIINGILCEGEIDIGNVMAGPGLSAAWKSKYMVDSVDALRPFIADHLATWEGTKLLLTNDGMYVARAIAGAMDPMLRAAAAGKEAGPRYSKAI